MRECRRRNIFFSLENRASSRLFGFPPVASVVSSSSVFSVDFAMCMYGTPYQKKTKIITNCPALSRLARKCCHVRHATVLEGRVRSPIAGDYVCRTALAGAYPLALCAEWAELLKSTAPRGSRTLDPVFEKRFLAKLVHAARQKFENPEPFFQRSRNEETPDPEIRIESDSSKERGDDNHDFLQEIIFGQRSDAETESRSRAKRQAISRLIASQPSSRR